MTSFEDALVTELAWLLRTGVPARGVRLSVREVVVDRLGHGHLGAREVSESVEAAVRAACRLVREMNAPDELVAIVCGAALEAVYGQGGETARWIAAAASRATAVLDELAGDEPDEASWHWLARRLEPR